MNTAALLAPVLGFGLTLGLIRFLLPRAERWGLIDHPEGHRKHHAGATPTVGGIAIVTGLVLTALLGQFAAEVHPAFWA
ncbi:MAG: hypothetical protein JJE42_17170, partial [Burkholderiales bacterium]|nr:hypothetical protein [Burkholderiales bacterium]